jgi:hypothetical protein
MTDSTFNLTALAERLFAEGRLQPLAGKIRRARDLASAHTDLTIALESLDALSTLLDSQHSEDFGRAVTESALLNNAVVLYARATKTNSDERGPFDLRTRLSVEEKVVHQELVDLRDKAIAHFGSGGSYTGLWQVEVVVLQVTGETVRPGVATRRQTIDKKLMARMRKQIETAHGIVRAVSSEKLDEVTAELNKMTPDVFENEIRQHPLNLGTLMASEQAADAARASAVEGGYKKGIVRHGA